MPFVNDHKMFLIENWFANHVESHGSIEEEQNSLFEVMKDVINWCEWCCRSSGAGSGEDAQ